MHKDISYISIVDFKKSFNFPYISSILNNSDKQSASLLTNRRPDKQQSKDFLVVANCLRAI